MNEYNYFLDIFNKLSEDDKQSVIDFTEFLVSRQNTFIFNRVDKLDDAPMPNEIVNFYHSLSESEQRKIYHLFEGMELGRLINRYGNMSKIKEDQVFFSSNEIRTKMTDNT